VVVAGVPASGGKISGQMILKLLQSFAPTMPAGTSLNEWVPFGKSDLKLQALELPFQLNNLQFGVEWQWLLQSNAVLAIVLFSVILLISCGMPVPIQKHPIIIKNINFLNTYIFIGKKCRKYP
jgi:hypothetical protein